MKPQNDVFIQRLLDAIGDQSLSFFARKCGIGESTLRSIIKVGAWPRTDSLIAIADAANVNIDWLAAGRGPKERGATQATPSDIEMNSFKKKQLVAPVEQAQAAIDTEAEKEECRRGLAQARATSQRVPQVQGMEAFKGWLLARQRMALKNGHSYPEQRARGALDEVAFFESDMRSNNE